MIVCLCHRVSDRDIARQARSGCNSFDELQFETGVGTGCGACLECAQDTFAHHCGGHTGTTCHAWPAGAEPDHTTPERRVQWVQAA